MLIHNATVYKPEAADAWCLNYEGRETHPNTPQLTELVTKECSHQLQNLLHISASWCAIIEVCMFPSTWGGSDTEKHEAETRGGRTPYVLLRWKLPTSLSVLSRWLTLLRKFITTNQHSQRATVPCTCHSI